MGYRVFATIKEASFSQAFGTLLDRIGLTDKKLTLHSCRHSFSTACRAANVPVDIRYRLEGHAGINVVAEGYGDHPIGVLYEWIRRIDPLAT